MEGTATTEIYTLSLHDALPISNPAGTSRLHCGVGRAASGCSGRRFGASGRRCRSRRGRGRRSEEHTSELQSRPHLVCRLLLEKKNLPIIPYGGFSPIRLEGWQL